MRSLYYICAQPATYYYSWQVDAMLLSFKKKQRMNTYLYEVYNMKEKE